MLSIENESSNAKTVLLNTKFTPNLTVPVGNAPVDYEKRLSDELDDLFDLPPNEFSKLFEPPTKSGPDQSLHRTKRLRSPRNGGHPTKHNRLSTTVTTTAKPGLPTTTKKVRKPRKKWTLEEDEILFECVRKHGPQGRTKASKSLPGRAPRGCRQRYKILTRKRNPNNTSGQWTPEEDNTLKNLVDEYGEHFEIISAKMETRSYQSCWARWRGPLGHKVQPDI